MSELATTFRPLARMGWGGKAAAHWRGLVQTDNQDLTGRTVVSRGQVGSVVWRGPAGVANFRLSGVTRNSAGVVLASCRVALCLTATNAVVATTFSDGAGAFAFDMPGTGPFYLIAYKPGSPDVAGTTVNTLVPAAV